MNTSWIAAALAALGLTGAPAMAETATSTSPVRLLVERSGASVTLRLEGAAAATTDVTYDLAVDGASTVRQKGRATLTPQGAEPLVRVSINADRPWRAALTVTANGRTFEETRASTDAVTR